MSGKDPRHIVAEAVLIGKRVAIEGLDRSWYRPRRRGILRGRSGPMSANCGDARCPVQSAG